MRSKKLCQFLRFTVDEALLGHRAELKEYSIAIGVFQRGREFDPGSDPIVRVQARRLRAKLREYYETAGKLEPVRIEYPIGGYAPVFSAASTSILSQAVSPPLQSIAVLPFVGVGSSAIVDFSDGLTDELIHTLTNMPELRVASRTSCYQFKGKPEDVRAIGKRLGVALIFEGSVRCESGRLRILVQLNETAAGANLWSGAYEKEMDDSLASQLDVARLVAAVVRAELDKNLP